MCVNKVFPAKVKSKKQQCQIHFSTLKMYILYMFFFKFVRISILKKYICYYISKKNLIFAIHVTYNQKRMPDPLFNTQKDHSG